MSLAAVDGVVKGRLGVWIRIAVFLGFLAFLVYHYIDPSLIFYAHGEFLAFPIEGPGMNSFAGQPLVPGSAAVHAAARLSYYLYSPWLGTALITGIAALLSLGSLAVMSCAGGRRWRPLIYLPALIVLALYARYCLAFTADYLGMILALLLACPVILSTRRGPWLGAVVFAVCSVVMYVLAVQGYLVFVVLALLAGFPARRRFAAGAAVLLWGGALPGLLGRGYFLMDIPLAYRVLWPQDFQGSATWLTLYAGMVGSFLVVGLACLVESWLTGKKETSEKVTQAKPSALGVMALRWLLGTAFLLVLTGTVFGLNYQSHTTVRYRINYFALTRQWPELLAAAKELPPEKFMLATCHDVDRALYHTGRLAYDMFQWPQDPAGLLLTPKKRPVGTDVMFHNAKRADVLFELGHVNQAERATCEAVELAQYHPEGLQRLAMIKAAKGQMAAARIYLQALSQDRVFQDWSMQKLEMMKTDPNLENAEDLQRIRSCILPEDSVRAATPLDLFTKNLHNHMAFEYLMAFSMLTRQPEVVSTCLGYLDNFDYPKGQIPRHYEEAALLYQSVSGKRVDLKGRRIDPKTTLRFAEFLKKFQGYASDRQAAAAALAVDYGDTYYYYHLLGNSAGGNR